MWNRTAEAVGRKKDSLKQTHASSEFSDNEGSSVVSRDEGLECPLCCESFNIVENVPYVLWCGHTLCKNCILGLQWVAAKFPTLPAQLPIFISCPWCNLLSFRLVYKGNIMFPKKNYFLLSMVESMNYNRPKSSYTLCESRQPNGPSNNNLALENQVTRSNHGRGQNHYDSESSGSSRNHTHVANDFSINSFLWKLIVFFIHLLGKFPLVIIFLLIILYAIPASVAILALYVLVTVLFALPSFLILYFAYPSLYWIVKEITA